MQGKHDLPQRARRAAANNHEMLSLIHVFWRLARSPLAVLLGLALLTPGWGAAGAQALGAAALREKHVALGPQLASNQFQGPLYLESTESSRQLEGDVYAVVEHPFATVSSALSDPEHWCDVLILHLNTKYCRAKTEAGATRLELRIGRKHDQPVTEATPVVFAFRTAAVEPEYLDIELAAPDGPLDTRDYRILFEAVPVEAARTFIHMRYSFAYGGAGRVAMKLYLGTVGRGKVGFTPVGTGGTDESTKFIGGVRGVVERNTMRYYLAIETYLDTVSLPPAQRLERSLEGWFAATQKYPRQLYEIDRTSYLEMKRREYQRQQERP